MPGDGLTGDNLFFQKKRAFAVHDPLTFNLIIRQMQAAHPMFGLWKGTRPRSTKPTQEVMDRLGIGPPPGMRSWTAKAHGGYPETDPMMFSPEDGSKQALSERDGMYYKGYVTVPGRAETCLLRHTRKDKRARPVEMDAQSYSSESLV